MTKLNGINSIGSIVSYRGAVAVIVDCDVTEYNGQTSVDYTVLRDSCECSDLGENDLIVLTLKSPLKKYVTKLASLEKKITKINQKASKEMEKVSKKNGWDKMAYDHYDNDYEWIQDGMSASMGLDELHDERYELLKEMVKTSRKVNVKVA